MGYRTQEEAIKELRRILKAGDVVYTVLRHVSQSGMSRSISCMIINKAEKRPWIIDYLVTDALDRKIDQEWGGLKTGGCGMDMGFELVYALSQKLFPKGFKVKDTGVWESSGGYALKQQWI